MGDNLMVNDAVQEAVKKDYYFVHNTANVKSYRQENQKKQKTNQNKKEKTREYYENLSEDEKIKKMNYANNRNKNMMKANREKNIGKIIILKEKICYIT